VEGPEIAAEEIGLRAMTFLRKS